VAELPVDRPWELVMPGAETRRLMAHLFPGDHQEHGAVLLAGVHVRKDRVRLLVRDVVLAEDGVDHLAGPRGYLMLRAEFVRNQVARARDERLVYLSVHNHGGSDQVAFSGPDLASHERGYPTLLDYVQGMPVGALVFATQAVAGDIWLPGGHRVAIDFGTIVDRSRAFLRPAPLKAINRRSASMFDRQVRIFGDQGQAILANSKVAIVGLGGLGSILAEILGRLGVGHFVLVDPQRADVTNLPRLVAARRSDVLLSEEDARRFGPLRPLLDRLRRRKVDIAARNIKRANRKATIERVFGSIADQRNAATLLDCDYIFLAADEMIARLVFNAIVHQYLIPGIQVGARVVANEETGAVSDVYAVSRPVTPDSGCLWCNGLINPTKLQLEATKAEQAEAQNYGTEAPAPSVITLNASAAADAANTFLFYITGLASPDAKTEYVRYRSLHRSVRFDEPTASPSCRECGRTASTRRAHGDGAALPTR
jgi:hypothetical protein